MTGFIAGLPGNFQCYITNTDLYTYLERDRTEQVRLVCWPASDVQIVMECGQSQRVGKNKEEDLGEGEVCPGVVVRKYASFNVTFNSWNFA